MANLSYEKSAWMKGYDLVAGVDEAGRGPLAGPVVASAVILKKTDFKERIDDSKKLTPSQRQSAFEEIARNALIGIGIVNNYFIDKVNIANATIMAMKQALFNLFVKPDLILVDGIIKIDAPIPCLCIKSGDAKSLSIAAASIVAKVTRDNLMLKFHDKYPRYNFMSHKGYGTKNHIYILQRFGPSPIHRKSFKLHT